MNLTKGTVLKITNSRSRQWWYHTRVGDTVIATGEKCRLDDGLNYEVKDALSDDEVCGWLAAIDCEVVDMLGEETESCEIQEIDAEIYDLTQRMQELYSRREELRLEELARNCSWSHFQVGDQVILLEDLRYVGNQDEAGNLIIFTIEQVEPPTYDGNLVVLLSGDRWVFQDEIDKVKKVAF